MSELDDVFSAYANVTTSPWMPMLQDCQRTRGYISIVLQGSYIPVKGTIIKLTSNMVTLKNDFSETTILVERIVRLTIYER